MQENHRITRGFAVYTIIPLFHQRQRAANANEERRLEDAFYREMPSRIPWPLRAITGAGEQLSRALRRFRDKGAPGTDHPCAKACRATGGPRASGFRRDEFSDPVMRGG